MSGGEVIHSGPARIVLAAAAQLRDPDLVERYSEEWLANLHGRARPQQWRDALSLLLRGARATHWAHHDTHDSRSRLVVASQVTMALFVGIGTVLLVTAAGWEPVLSRHVVGMLTPCVWLMAAGATGLVLLVIRRSWLATLSWVAIGVLIAILSSIYTHSFWNIKSGVTFGSAPWCFFYLGTWLLHIASWWALYAALTLFIHRKPSPVIRVLAATDVVASLTPPAWAYEYADRLRLTDLIQLMSGLLNVDESAAIRGAPRILFLLATLIVMAAWRCGVIAKSLILPARLGPSGARMCPR